MLPATPPPPLPSWTGLSWYFAVISRLDPPAAEDPGAGCPDADLSGLFTRVDGVTGRFFANRKPRTANKLACDTGVTARLWQVSADLVGLAAAA